MALNSGSTRQKSGFVILLLILLVTLGVLFRKSFERDYVHFANDGPVGALMANKFEAWHAMWGHWESKNWIGSEAVPPPPTLEEAAFVSLGRIYFAKFMHPLSLMVLGICAWVFFRQLRFNTSVCIIGAVAAALNMNFFSNACWGQYSRPFTLGTTFLALAALVSAQRSRPWMKIILAGFAIGWGIMHGFDVGALFSICAAAFLLFLAFNEPGPTGPKLVKGVLRVAVMAAFAALLATHVLVVLISTQIKGVVGMEQDTKSKNQHWDMATQWSTPKAEVLRVIIPGLFGYRMDSPGGGQYWGRVGQPENSTTFRFSGNGEYAGVFVVLIATLALAHSFRKKNTALIPAEQRAVWFWSGLGVVTLLLAFGHYAPFYQLFYALPYASTIRNPMKFMHLFHMALLILFVYGLEIIWRQYLKPALPKASSFGEQVRKWWSSPQSVDKGWFAYGCLGAIGASLLGFLLYTSSRKELLSHLEKSGFDKSLATVTASFSFHEVGWYLFFLVLSVVLIALIFSGWFSGARARLAFILIGILLVVDLGRSNAYWVLHWDYKYKYETNPIIEVLRDKPYEHRVVMAPFQLPQIEEFRRGVYGIEWHQHHFLYYDIQCLDVIQSPRVGSDDYSFQQALSTPATLLRRWELTNTRFVLGPNRELIDALNQQLDPVKKRFRFHTGFDILPKPGIQPRQYQDLTAVVNPDGKLGLTEFTGALPRAKLYSNWQTPTNDQAVLDQVIKPEFDPHQAVLVSPTTPVPAAAAAPNQDAGSVEITSYAPRKVQLSTDVKTAAVLLLNDKFNANWKVTVDGQAAPLLRCNYMMRGVYLQPGQHKVVFTFAPPVATLYVSLTAIALAFGLTAFLIIQGRREDAGAEAPNILGNEPQTV